MPVPRRLGMVVTARHLLGPAEERAYEENADHEKGDDGSHGNDSSLRKKHLNPKE